MWNDCRRLGGILACWLSAPLASAPAGALYLLEQPSAQAIAGGDAVAARPLGVSALRSNPAGIRRLERAQELELSRHLDAAGWTHDWAGMGLQRGRLAVAVEGLLSRLEPIYIFDSAGKIQDRIDVSSRMAGAGLAWSTFGDRLVVGVAGRVFESSVLKYNNSGYALDLGVQAAPQGFGFRAGVAAANLGAQTAYISKVAPLPFGIRTALSSDAFGMGPLKASLSAQFDHFPDVFSVSPFKGGLDLQVTPSFKGSAGVQWGRERIRPSWGLSYSGQRSALHYAFVPDDLLGPSHLMTLRLWP